VLALYDIAETTLWKLSAAIFAAAMLAYLLTYPHRRRRVVGAMPPPVIMAVYIGLGSVVILAMLAYVLCGFPYAAAACIAALIVNFLTLAFVTALDVVMQQSSEGPL
jgi:uncharacterized membrane protein